MPDSSTLGSVAKEPRTVTESLNERAGTFERLLRDQQNRLVAGALLMVIAASWTYTLAGVGMSATQSWGPVDVLAMLAMWWVMMIAMMLPSAASVILLVAALNRRAPPSHRPFGATGAFVAGYLLGWFAFSIAAVLLQWPLERHGWLSLGMRIGDATTSGLVLLAAGAWQLSSLKRACLMHCRSPVDFLVRHRRAGSSGALVTGLHHALYCLGCCWALMLLLFVGGVMNVWWIAGLALFVFVEKRWIAGATIGRVAGCALIVVGVLLMLLD